MVEAKRDALEAATEEVVAFARRMIVDGLSTGTSGNISVRVEDRIAITPASMSYEEMEPEDVCVVDSEGRAVSGGSPSSELQMHLTAYRDDRVGAVVHTHPMYTTALSTVIDELPAIHYVIARLGGPVRVAPYATPGSLELARRFEAGLEGRTGVILANHGAVTVGGSLQEAYARSVTLEWLAQLYFTASVLGRRPAIVSAEQVNELMQRLERRKGGGAA